MAHRGREPGYVYLHSPSLLFLSIRSVCSLGLCVAGCRDSQKSSVTLLEFWPSNYSVTHTHTQAHMLDGSWEMRACHPQFHPPQLFHDLDLGGGLYSGSSLLQWPAHTWDLVSFIKDYWIHLSELTDSVLLKPVSCSRSEEISALKLLLVFLYSSSSPTSELDSFGCNIPSNKYLIWSTTRYPCQKK